MDRGSWMASSVEISDFEFNRPIAAASLVLALERQAIG